MTNKAAYDIDKIVSDESIGIDKAMQKIETIEKDIKFDAFGKTRVNKNKPGKKIKAKGADTDEELLNRQTKKIEDEVIRIKSQ